MVTQDELSMDEEGETAKVASRSNPSTKGRIALELTYGIAEERMRWKKQKRSVWGRDCVSPMDLKGRSEV